MMIIATISTCNFRFAICSFVTIGGEWMLDTINLRFFLLLSEIFPNITVLNKMISSFQVCSTISRTNKTWPDVFLDLSLRTFGGFNIGIDMISFTRCKAKLGALTTGDD